MESLTVKNNPVRDFFKTNLITVLGVSVGVLIGGLLLFAVIQFKNEVDATRTQTAQNTATLQAVVDFLNKSIAAQQAIQPAK